MKSNFEKISFGTVSSLLLRLKVFVLIVFILGITMFSSNAIDLEAFRSCSVRLQSKTTKLFVTAWGFEPVAEVRSSAFHKDDTRALFDFFVKKNGSVAVFSHANNRFWTVSDEAHGFSVFSCEKTLKTAACFFVVHNDDSTISFKCASNGKYLSVIRVDTTMVLRPDSQIVSQIEAGRMQFSEKEGESSRDFIVDRYNQPQAYSYFSLRAQAIQIKDSEKFEAYPEIGK